MFHFFIIPTIIRIRDIMKIIGEANIIHNISKDSGPAYLKYIMNNAKLVASKTVPAATNMFLLVLSITKKTADKTNSRYVNIVIMSIFPNPLSLFYRHPSEPVL